jgi:tyrosyl-tRNA synthetase
MKMNKQPEQSVMSMDILEGLDGKEKMSKSLNNYVGIADAPSDMYGKILSIPDALIPRYFLLATYTPESEIAETERQLKNGDLHPRDAKMRLAKQIVAIYHGDAAGAAAEENFIRTFSEGKAPEDVAEFSLSDGCTVLDALMETKSAKSRSDARRLIEANAVTNLDTDEKMKDAMAVIPAGTYRVGKHTFFKVK